MSTTILTEKLLLIVLLKNKLMSIFLNTDLLNTAFSSSETQWLLGFVENAVLFVFLVFALFLIMITPVVLFYSTIDNYFKVKKKKLTIDHTICCENSTSHPTYKLEVCEEYINLYKKFIGNSFGLASWGLFSIIYITIRYGSLKSGIGDYFHFPFEVVEIFHFNDVIASITSFDSNWFFMGIVFALTVISYQIGSYIAPILARKSLPNQLDSLHFAQ